MNRRVWWGAVVCCVAAVRAASSEDEAELERLLAEEAAEEDTAPLRAAGEEAYWEAVRLLEEPTESGQTAGRELLEAAARQEFTHAQNFLAGCYQSGSYGFRQSDRKAVQFFRLAAERGNAFAQVNLGRAYLLGQGVWKNEDQARRWLTAAVQEAADYSVPAPPEWYWEWRATADADNSTIRLDEAPAAVSSRLLAHFLLGLLAQEDEAYAEAQAHFLAASEAGPRGRYGLPGAALNAALNAAFGQGVKRDLAAADALLERSRQLATQESTHFVHSLTDRRFFDRFLRAKINEEVEALLAQRRIDLQEQIASRFADDTDDLFDPHEAAKWFALAAEEGDRPWAMLNLAFLYAGDAFGAPDMAKAADWFRRAGEDGGHTLGWSNYALCLYHGLGVEPDRAAAEAIFAEHAETDITCYLGTLGEVPAGIQTFSEKLKLLEHWAKRKKETHARYLLGRRYRFGWGVDWNRDTANRWFRRAAREGHAAAHYELGHAHEMGFGVGRDLAQAFDYYLEAARGGNVDAVFEVAYAVAVHGFEAPRHLLPAGPDSRERAVQAIFFYELYLEAKPEDASAWNNLGVRYEQRALDAEADSPERAEAVARMLECYERGLAHGSAYAAWNMGKLLESGHLIAPDAREAFRHYMEAAEGGHTGAVYEVAERLLAGEGVLSSVEEAMHYFRLYGLDDDADKTKRIEALRQLANFYLGGFGQEADIEAAAFWLRLSALQGNLAALPAYADLLLRQERFREARKFLLEISRTHSDYLRGEAFHRLHILYEEGLGVRPNPRRAERFRQKAIASESASALTAEGDAAIARGEMAAPRGRWERALDPGSRPPAVFGR